MSSSSTTNGDDKFPEFLFTLPKQTRESWDLYQYQGFWYPSFVIRGIVAAQQRLEVLPTDTFIIAGSPKTGNTWLKALCFAIATREKNENPLLSNMPHSLVPFMEAISPRDPTIRHKLMSTHMPYTSLPTSILSAGCKIVYICREPKDSFVSLWHFIHRTEELVSNPGTPTKHKFAVDHEFDMFCQGKNPYGPYWDHVLGYYRASLDKPDQVLFLKYEQVKEDTAFYVKKLAAFMDLPFSTQEELEGVPEKIAAMCSFNNLSGLEVNKEGKYGVKGLFQLDNKAFFRKGAVGDWKNHLTAEMAERMDRITEDKLQGSGFTFGCRVVSTNLFT